MTKEKILLPVALILLFSMLVGLVYWRMDSSMNVAKWEALVTAYPGKVATAEESITDAKMALAEATTVGVPASEQTSLKAAVTEVETSIADIEPLKQYLTVTETISKNSPTIALDPFEIAKSDELDKLEVTVPSDYLSQWKTSSLYLEQLKYATTNLQELTEALEATTVERQTNSSNWASARKTLTDQVSAVEKFNTEKGSSITESESYKQLQTQLEAAKKVLKEHEKISELTDFATEVELFNTQRTTLEKALKAANTTWEAATTVPLEEVPNPNIPEQDVGEEPVVPYIPVLPEYTIPEYFEPEENYPETDSPNTNGTDSNPDPTIPSTEEPVEGNTPEPNAE